MALQQELGQKGEQIAADFLIGQGFTILHRNWRHKHYEIDIICYKAERLHFVEVKLRTCSGFGTPEKGVGRNKFSKILKAADEFLHQNQQYRNVQYDILAITLLPERSPEVLLIEDVFY